MNVPSRDYSSWILSFLFHAALLGLCLPFLILNSSNETESVSFEVITNPTPVTGQTLPRSFPKPIVPVAPKPAPAPTSRAVYGLSKKSITDDSSSVDVKKGNTIAKAEDKLILRAGDEEALPIPADEFMVSQMPRIAREIRAPYPPEAKSKRVQGVVNLELLIDADGKVRQVKLLQGPGFGLNEAAAQAASQFLFEPARVGDKTVAVMIRYNYKFVLE